MEEVHKSFTHSHSYIVKIILKEILYIDSTNQVAVLYSGGQSTAKALVTVVWSASFAGVLQQ